MTTTDTDHSPQPPRPPPRASPGSAASSPRSSMTLGREGDARLAAELTDLAPGDRLLDLGCGPGAAVRFAARRGVRVTGVDPAPVMLDVARRLTRRGDVTYLQGAAEAIPLPDAAATVVWALATVHHWPSLEPGDRRGGTRARPRRSVPRRRAAHDAGRDRARQPRLDRRPGRRLRRAVS